MSETIGFIGLGLMGAGFTRRLIASGYTVSGYDPDPARQKEATANGVTIAASAAEVAKAADIILVCVINTAAVEDATVGPRGIAAAAWDIWCVLIAASVLTTFQHHFIDIPTGALLGLFALWLFPAEGPLPFRDFAWTSAPKRRRLCGFYALGALALLAGAWLGAYASANWLLLLWRRALRRPSSLSPMPAQARRFSRNPLGAMSRWPAAAATPGSRGSVAPPACRRAAAT